MNINKNYGVTRNWLAKYFKGRCSHEKGFELFEKMLHEGLIEEVPGTDRFKLTGKGLIAYQEESMKRMKKVRFICNIITIISLTAIIVQTIISLIR